jgi:hypothetical protein
MTTKTSSGLNKQLLDTGSFKSIFNLGKIKIYGYNAAVADPATADAAIDTSTQYTLLCTLTNASGATGLTFESSATSLTQAGIISKKSTETWSGVNAASGVAKFYRLVSATDDATLSTSQARVQNTVGVAYPAGIVLADVNFVNGVTTTLPNYSFTLPSY